MPPFNDTTSIANAFNADAQAILKPASRDYVYQQKLQQQQHQKQQQLTTSVPKQSEKVNQEIQEKSTTKHQATSNGAVELSDYRLTWDTLDSLPNDTVVKPDYNPREVTPGILHIGTGNFALAHMASYVHDILKDDPNWGIVATSIRSERAVKSLRDQDGLYLLVKRENENKSVSVMAPVVKTIYGPAQPSNIFNEIAKENIKMVTLTVTNKGYYLSSGGKLDRKAADIKHDLTNPNHPKTAYGYLAQGLIARKNACGKPISIVSLDNIEENTSTFRKSFVQYMELYEKLSGESGLVDWIHKNVDFLVTLVDRITPEPTEEFRSEIHMDLGFESTLTIGCESFRQLVIEKGRFDTPSWDKAGVQIVNSCASYWQRKFYCLNAGHMIVAASGNRLGTPTIHETTARPAINNLLKMAQNEWCTIIKGEKSELSQYTGTIRKRFADPSLNDTVRRVGARATSKVSDRLLSAVERSLKLQGKILKAPTFATALYLLNLGLVNEKNQKFIQDDAELHKMVSIHEFIMRRLATLPADRNSLAPAAVQEFLEDMSLALGGEPRFTKLSKNRQFVMCLAWSLVAIHRNGLEKAVSMLESYDPMETTNNASLARAQSGYGSSSLLNVPSNNGTLSGSSPTSSKRASCASMF